MLTDADREILRAIADRATTNGSTPVVPPHTTMVAILLAHLRRTYEPLHRRDALVWSRTLGRAVAEREAAQGPDSALLARLLLATDSPRTRDGAPSVDSVLRVWRGRLAVAWADMLGTLPDEAMAAEVDGAAEEELRRALAALLGRVVTLGRRLVDGHESDVQAQSLLDCCLAWALPGCWGRIRSYWLWCRLDGADGLPSDGAAARAARRRRLRVALRIELAAQVGARPLADWTGRRLTVLVDHYGLGRAVQIGHTRTRAIELSREILADLLGEPETDPKPPTDSAPQTCREPGEDG